LNAFSKADWFTHFGAVWSKRGMMEPAILKFLN